jgi:hypothetical protein
MFAQIFTSCDVKFNRFQIQTMCSLQLIKTDIIVLYFVCREQTRIILIQSNQFYLSTTRDRWIDSWQKISTN